MNRDMLLTLFDYNLWAWARVWHCIDALTDAQFTQAADYSFGSVQRQITHIMSVDMRWFARIQNQPVPPAFEWDAFPDKAAARAAWDALYARLRAELATFTNDDFLRVIEYDMPHRGGIKRNTLWQIVAHVVNHGTDHRAQVLALLHQVGAPTTEQDIMFYFWEQAQNR